MSDGKGISVYKKLVADKIKNKYDPKNADVVRANMKMLDSTAEKANKISKQTGVYYVVDEKATKEFLGSLSGKAKDE